MAPVSYSVTTPSRFGDRNAPTLQSGSHRVTISPPGDPAVSPAPTVPASAWSLIDGIASQPLPEGDVRLELAEPSAGLRIRRADGRADCLLGVDLSDLADHWARGRDVAAVYEPTDPRRLRSTVMWRTHPRDGGVTAWEVIASAQTSLLETDVTVAVHSEIEADELVWSTADLPPRWRPLAAGHPLPKDGSAVLARRAGSTCLVAVHPADARQVDVTSGGGRCVIDCRLFGSALEKGVLLRSRVLAALGPSHDDEAWANRLLAAFAASPPPLAT